ncbi:MAG: hypothetical protein D6679_00505, partial [Candidatus Hydrogenedentota bacterium]
MNCGSAEMGTREREWGRIRRACLGGLFLSAVFFLLETNAAFAAWHLRIAAKAGRISSAVSEVVTAVKTVGRRETYLRSAGAGAFA